MNAIQHRNGLTIADVLVVLVAAVILLSIAGVLFADGGGGKAPLTAMRENDAAQLRQIHQAFVIWGRESQGRYPTPGLIRRHPIDLLGDGNAKYIHGQGAEDVTQNTTANVYSAMIAQNYFTPQLVVSPLERSPNVRMHDDYSYNAYSPAHNTYWDERFRADLAGESHASYAHLVLHGQRKRLHWRDTMNSHAPILGNRGPKDGLVDPASLTCNLDGTWEGHVVLADNAVRRLDTTTPENVTYTAPGGESAPDNIFAVETGWGGSDFILSFTLNIDEKEPVIQHD